MFHLTLEVLPPRPSHALISQHSTQVTPSGRSQRGWHLTQQRQAMSLHFPQDTLSKREKQEMFKRSLDDQRRMKQETSHQQHTNLPSNTGNHVPGLASSSVAPDDLSIPGLNQVVPGLNQRPGYAPRFEGSSSPQQDKQPYMSAVSACAVQTIK